jgi:hypothetical protein
MHRKMDKEKLKKMADNPNNIPGIYNYCDRWCERCNFTSRCLNYQMSDEIGEGKEINDVNNKQFWEQMGNIFALTRELLEDMAREEGIDLTNLKISEEEEAREKQREELVEQNHCVIASHKYAEMAKKWFDSSKDIFEEKEKELNRQLSLSLPLSEPEKEAVTLTDACDIIFYYLFFISVKIMRACYGKINELEEMPDYFPKDSDGSAKIALIAIDRSISAWGILLRHLPEKGDEILDILVHLERLRNAAEKEFPDARNFIRPGFDE